MSRRTNEGLMALHEAGKRTPVSDDGRLRRLIAASYANKLVSLIETCRAEDNRSDPAVVREGKAKWPY